MSQRMTPTLTAVLADVVNARPALEAVLKKWQSVAKQEDQLEADDKVLVSNHLNNLLNIREQLIVMADPTYQQVVDSQRIVSIQVQTTRLTGAGVEVVPYKSKDYITTHWSLYTRNADGIATWVEDIAIHKGTADAHYAEAMLKAAKLSMEHSAFIEQVK